MSDSNHEHKNEASRASKAGKVAAGAGAGLAVAGGAVAPLNQYDNNKNIARSDVPAYYQKSPYQHKTPDQAAEQCASKQGAKIVNPQKESQPTTLQKVGKLGDETVNVTGAAADGEKLRGQARQQAVSQPSVNKGIEAARQKAEAKSTETNKSQSTNKGISSFQSKASGQTTDSSKGSSSGSSASNGKSNGGQSQ
jgi:hypothetical protein